jgi:hypothetical protein
MSIPKWIIEHHNPEMSSTGCALCLLNNYHGRTYQFAYVLKFVSFITCFKIQKKNSRNVPSSQEGLVAEYIPESARSTSHRLRYRLHIIATAVLN